MIERVRVPFRILMVHILLLPEYKIPIQIYSEADSRQQHKPSQLLISTTQITNPKVLVLAAALSHYAASLKGVSCRIHSVHLPLCQSYITLGITVILYILSTLPFSHPRVSETQFSLLKCTDFNCKCLSTEYVLIYFAVNSWVYVCIFKEGQTNFAIRHTAEATFSVHCRYSYFLDTIFLQSLSPLYDSFIYPGRIMRILAL